MIPLSLGKNPLFCKIWKVNNTVHDTLDIYTIDTQLTSQIKTKGHFDFLIVPPFLTHKNLSNVLCFFGEYEIYLEKEYGEAGEFSESLWEAHLCVGAEIPDGMVVSPVNTLLVQTALRSIHRALLKFGDQQINGFDEAKINGIKETRFGLQLACTVSIFPWVYPIKWQSCFPYFVIYPHNYIVEFN